VFGSFRKHSYSGPFNQQHHHNDGMRHHSIRLVSKEQSIAIDACEKLQGVYSLGLVTGRSNNFVVFAFETI